MCGILGVYDHGLIPSESIRDALKEISHRGPDGEGFYEDLDIKLAMCRLAIVDIVGGKQPAFNDSASVVLVFNGEIYNFKELRSLLQSKGYEFKSSGDAEVIANLYSEFGPDFVNRLNGMFAIALWDKRVKRLYLYRDRVGKKPLWYSMIDDKVFFSSEIKGLLRLGIDREVDFESIHDSLVYGYCKAPNSPFKKISQVEPGHYVMFDNLGIHVVQYWSMDSIRISILNINEAIEQLRTLVYSAVEYRLNTEREFGVFLSGGVDSTIIAAVAQSLIKQPVKTFTAGFNSQEFDERSYGTQVAKILGTKHTNLEIIPEPELILKKIALICDQPFADSSVIPTFLLAQGARREVVVALGGDGGDEVFGGYDRYRAILNTRLLKVNYRLNMLNLDFVHFIGERFVRSVQMIQLGKLAERYDSLSSQIHPNELRQITKFPFSQSRSEIYEIWQNKKDTVLREMQKQDLKSYIPNDLMYKADMASMVNGLEVRSPFLDYRLIEFGLSLPADFKVTRTQGKSILRHMAEGFVGKEILRRPKMGFAIPRAEWIRGPLKELSAEILFGKRTESRGWIDTQFTMKMFDEHIRGRNRDRMLWPALCLELWARTWLD
jgi:asparagine synthase (glutamine-hydrolysing)